jgi:hypothetical protein
MTTNPNAFVTDDELIAAYPVFADDAWRVTVTSSADDTYTATVAGVDYSHGPTTGETTTEIRDGLLAAMAPTVQGLFESTADGVAALIMLSAVPNYSLNVLTDPASLIATVESGVAPADRQCALDLTKCLICPEKWGCNTWRAHLAATVHYLKMWGRSKGSAGATPGGQTTGMTQGPFSQSWATTQPKNGDDAWWSTTPEGQQFLAIRASLGTFARGMIMGAGCRRGVGLGRGGRAYRGYGR